jgi:hypothetical protein
VLLIEQVLAQAGTSIAEWFPGSAGAAVVRTPGDFLAPGAGAALLLAYTLAIALAGLLLVTRRDA